MIKKISTLIVPLFMAFAVSSSAQVMEKPNILFIAVDDLKPTLGCFGDTIALTPNIDAIAAGGITFTKNYCQQAVCAPSRASLLTSRYPDQTRVWDLNTLMRDMDPDIVTLPQYLRQYGYRTAATGKIFDSRSVDSGRDAPSWSIPYRGAWDIKYYSPEYGKPSYYYYASQHAKDTLALLEAEAVNLGVDKMTYVRERYFPAFENADVPVDAYTDGAIANVGIELMEEAVASGDPFFLAIGFQRPHLPFNAPKPFWDLYNRDELSLAEFREKAVGTPSIAYHNSGELRSYTGIPESGDLPESTQLELIHAYYAATSYIDYLVGQVMARLVELGEEENTIIVLWGDHGWHLGDHQLWCKHSNFEQATRSPLIISYPGQANQGAQVDAPTEFTDIAPTLCELTGLDIPAYFEGESLIPLFQDTLTTLREGAMSQYPRGENMGYSLRTERYRYTRWTAPDGSEYATELYDYLSDPMETVNYSFDPAYEEVRHRLDSLIKERILVPSTQDKIAFRISGPDQRGDTVKLTGASIYLARETQETNESGYTLFTHHKGGIDYIVNATGYKPVTGNLHVNGDTVISIVMQLEEPIYTVLVRVSDYYTGLGLLNSLVTVDGNQGRTDNAGEFTEYLTEGTYVLTVEKERYPTISDTLFIARDTSIQYSLEATHSTIKIWLKEGTTPVNQAQIKLNEIEKLSNSLGISSFESLPTGEMYEYSVHKEGFQVMTGSLFLVVDTSLNLQMERLTGMNLEVNGPELKVWPNPAGDLLYFQQGNGAKGGLIEITDTFGRRVFEKRTIHESEILQIHHLEPGIYWIRLAMNQEVLPVKFVKYE